MNPPAFQGAIEIVRTVGDRLKSRYDAAQIAYVASARLDGFWEYGEDTFNCLGGALLVTEAGVSRHSAA